MPGCTLSSTPLFAPTVPCQHLQQRHCHQQCPQRLQCHRHQQCPQHLQCHCYQCCPRHLHPLCQFKPNAAEYYCLSYYLSYIIV